MTPAVSLVVATLGRVDELAALLDSLAIQAGPTFEVPPFEVIVVDQNGDDRLDALLAHHARHFPLRHLRSSVRALSHARNLALPHCTGAILGFPDDDCSYPPGVLARVIAAFDDPALGVFTGAAVAPTGRLGSGRWHNQAGPITRANAWTTAMSFTLFIRRDLMDRVGRFDEQLGLGARYGAAEETDLLLRALALGAVARYDPSLLITHPDKQLTPTAAARAFAYGTGCGYVLRKHRSPLATVLNFLVRPAGGALLYLLRGNLLASGYYVRTLAGRLAGYCRVK